MSEEKDILESADASLSGAAQLSVVLKAIDDELLHPIWRDRATASAFATRLRARLERLPFSGAASPPALEQVSGLRAVKAMIMLTLDEEREERVSGSEFALERGSVYENVLEWIDSELAAYELAAVRQSPPVHHEKDEKDLGAGLIHQVASPLAESLPRLNSGVPINKCMYLACNREQGHSGHHINGQTGETWMEDTDESR